MAQHYDILDERDPIAFPFLGSIFLHCGVVAILFFGWYWMNARRENFGEPNPAGGPAYTVSAVQNIPIPQPDAPQNPVASDTKSLVPTPPFPQDLQRKLSLPDKNAFEIPERKKRENPRPQRRQQYVPKPAPPNQVYSDTRQALSNPMYGSQSGAGQVGIGPNSPLGSRLGFYAELVRQRIAQNWNTNGLDARTQSSAAIISFYIMRDGTIRNPQVVQSSGNPSIDNTALRAVYNSSPLPQLPPQVTDSYISAQFTFNLR
jgi:protein TonB